MNISELYWVAGFLEGEGCFTICGRSISISAVQVNKEPISRLNNFFNGFYGNFFRKEIRNNNGRYNRWMIYGKNAASLMMTLYPLMSQKRKDRIKELLSFWKRQPIRNGDKVYCKRRHLLLGDNLYVYPNGRRLCKTCNNQ